MASRLNRREKALVLGRIGLGGLVTIDGILKFYMDWHNAFGTDTAPAFLKALDLWFAHLFVLNPHLSAIIVGGIEILLGLGLMLGLLSGLGYLAGMIWFLFIWLLPENIGGFPWLGQSGLDEAIVYVFAFLLAYAGQAENYFSLRNLLFKRRRGQLKPQRTAKEPLSV